MPYSGFRPNSSRALNIQARPESRLAKLKFPQIKFGRTTGLPTCLTQLTRVVIFM